VKKEARTLHAKAVDSLVLGVDHFNRAWDRGRVEAVLIMLDRAFELLLKAIILHRSGSIRDRKRAEITIGFDACLRKCLTDAELKCLSEDDAVALQNLNSLRDAAQHYMIELSEEQLYVYAQAAVSLFSRLTKEVLELPLRSEIPHRILPVCAKPTADLGAVFDTEFSDIKRMVGPGSRKRLDARAKLRSMAVLQSSLDGKKSQASDRELDLIVKRINAAEDWRTIFPGVATLTIEPDAEGPGLSLKIQGNAGEKVRLVKEGDPDASVIAVRKVNELGFYNLGIKDMAQKMNVPWNRLLWLIERDRLQQNPEFFKLIEIGSQKHKRYSDNCMKQLAETIATIDLDDAYENRVRRNRRRRQVNRASRRRIDLDRGD
jgi:hypothetical protein